MDSRKSNAKAAHRMA